MLPCRLPRIACWNSAWQGNVTRFNQHWRHASATQKLGSCPCTIPPKRIVNPRSLKFGTGRGALYTAGMATHKTDFDRTGAATPYRPGQFGILGLAILTAVTGVCLAIIRLPIQPPLSALKALPISLVILAYFLWATRHHRHDQRVGMMIPFISFGPIFIEHIWRYFHLDRYPQIFIGYVPLVLSLGFLSCGLWFGIRAARALCERPPTTSASNGNSVTPQ